jgi:hypothetical protein
VVETTGRVFHFPLDASTMPITPKRLAVRVKKNYDGYHLRETMCCNPNASRETNQPNQVDGYQNRPELLRFVAHSKQCLLADTTAQLPHTFLPQSLQAKGLVSTAPPMSMSSATGCRSRRNVAAVRRFAAVVFGTRRWTVEQAVRVVASRTNAEWTFAASKWRE